MVVAKDRHVVHTGGTCYGNGPVKVKASVVEGPGQCDRIRMQRSDDVGARSQVLGLAHAHGDAYAENDTGSPTEGNGSDVAVSAQSVSLPRKCRNVDATAPEDRCARMVAQLSVLPVQESPLGV